MLIISYHENLNQDENKVSSFISIKIYIKDGTQDLGGEWLMPVQMKPMTNVQGKRLPCNKKKIKGTYPY